MLHILLTYIFAHSLYIYLMGLLVLGGVLWVMRDSLTKTIKEVLSSDNVLTEAEIRIICIAARSMCSRGVDTAG